MAHESSISRICTQAIWVRAYDLKDKTIKPHPDEATTGLFIGATRK